MSELAIMAIISVITTAISYAATKYQQDSEFSQQKQLQEGAQLFQSEREDINFERNSYAGQMQQMLDAGFNPNLAASSLLGGNSVAAAGSDSSPAAPTTNSAIGALQSMLGQGGQNLYDMWKNNAEIKNIEANTDKTEVETGLLPRDYMLRNLSVTKQLEVWDASIKRTAAAQHLDEEQTRLLSQQNLYYGRMAESQIKSYEAQVAQAYADAKLSLEKINTEKSKQRELDTQAGLNVANTELAHDQSVYVSNLASTEYYKSESARIAQEFEKKLGGIPLTADGKKHVQKLIADGDIEGINNFYQDVFTTALNQQAGNEYGTMPKAGVPFGILSSLPLRGYQRSLLENNYNLPYWNPYQMTRP